MTTPKQAEPRRHHYVPRCWLAGFTDTGNQDGTLYVTDFKRRNQWGAVPGTAGLIRDFYRLEDERASDPVMAERALSHIEDAVAPILRGIDREMRPPTVEEMEPLLYFMAIQWSRVPAFRPFVLGVLDKLSYEQIARELESPERWRRALEKAGMSPDDPGAGYEGMKEFHKAKAYALTAQRIGTSRKVSRRSKACCRAFKRDFGPLWSARAAASSPATTQ